MVRVLIWDGVDESRWIGMMEAEMKVRRAGYGDEV